MKNAIERYLLIAPTEFTRCIALFFRIVKCFTGKVVAASLLLIWFAQPALAMDPTLPPPPYADVSDKLGMNLTTGFWQLTGPSIHIGPQGHGGLSWNFNFSAGYLDLGVYEGTIKYQYFDSNHVYVTVLGKNEEFTYNGSTWDSTGGGGTLVQSGGNWIYTDSSGTVSQFAGISPLGAWWYTEAIVSSTTYHDGVALTYTWHTYSGGSKEIISVNNNLGYQLKFQYACTNPSPCYEKINGVVAINNAVEYCDPTALVCTLSNPWPALNWSIVSPNWFTGTTTLMDTMNHTWLYTLSMY